MIKKYNELKGEMINLIEGSCLENYLTDIQLFCPLPEVRYCKSMVKSIKINGEEIEKSFKLDTYSDLEMEETVFSGTLPSFKVGDVVSLLIKQETAYVDGRENVKKNLAFEFLIIPEDIFLDVETDEEEKKLIDSLIKKYLPTVKTVSLDFRGGRINLAMIKELEKKTNELNLELEDLVILEKNKVKITLYGRNIKSKIFDLHSDITGAKIQ